MSVETVQFGAEAFFIVAGLFTLGSITGMLLQWIAWNTREFRGG